MERNTSFSQEQDGPLPSDEQWNDLYRRLFVRTLQLIRSLHVPAWHGQEEDLARDIVQTTLERAIIRLRQAAAGEATPIASLPGFCWTTAHNHCLDLKRREQRLIRLYTYTDQPRWDLEEQLSAGYDPIGDIIEQITQTSSLAVVAHLIVTLPDGQRTALLINLAYLSFPYFSNEQTPLETALRHVGITLRDYVAKYPVDAKQKNRYASSLSLAYKKLRHLATSQACSESFVA